MSAEEQSSHETSIQFGDRMGAGWNAGLSRLYKGVDVVLNWKVYEYTEVNRFRDVGDIDTAVAFTSAETLADIFPPCAKFPEPPSIRTTKSRYFFVEFKRSCHEKSMGKYLKQFVSFYGQLLDPANHDRFRTDGWPESLRESLKSPDLVLLFVFNGEDNVKVQDAMRVALGGQMEIRGRQVVTVHCSSEELIKWDDMQLLSELEVENDTLKAALEAEKAASEAALEAEKAASEAEKAALKAEIEQLRQLLPGVIH